VPPLGPLGAPPSGFMPPTGLLEPFEGFADGLDDLGSSRPTAGFGLGFGVSSSFLMTVFFSAPDFFFAAIPTK